MPNLNEILASLNGEVNNVAASPFTAPILQQAFEARAKERSEKLVKVAIGVTESVETLVAQSVNILRAARRQEKLAKENLDKMNLAAKYFAETGNPLPLFKLAGATELGRQYCRSVGADCPNYEDALWSVPEGFQPAA
jgi:Asp/Glu/hydantoin racemase